MCKPLLKCNHSNLLTRIAIQKFKKKIEKKPFFFKGIRAEVLMLGNPSAYLLATSVISADR